MHLNLLRFWLVVKILGFLGGSKEDFVDLFICSLGFAAIFIVECFVAFIFGKIEAYKEQETEAR